jgi:hypothetical protein
MQPEVVITKYYLYFTEITNITILLYGHNCSICIFRLTIYALDTKNFRETKIFIYFI